MHVYFSTSPNGDVFSRQWTSGWREDQDKGLPSFVWSNITFGDWNDHRTEHLEVTLPEVQNRSLHVVLDLTSIRLFNGMRLCGQMSF